MKIKTLKIKNFKFYINANVSVNSKNFLLYGENGSGKSSLYWALYIFFKSIFSANRQNYYQKLDYTIENSLANHNRGEDAEIELIFDTNSSVSLGKNGNLGNSINTGTETTIHFLNHDKLSNLLVKNQKFYKAMTDELFEKFTFFMDLANELSAVGSRLNTSQDTQALNKILNATLIKLARTVNYILKFNFNENMKIEFLVSESFRCEQDVSGQWQLASPKVEVKINGYTDFYLRINEARIKLIAIVIYIILMQYNEKNNQSSEIKLLVLDDILLSLDMAHRGRILEYIFEKFSNEYQIFILTHDIFFYDLVKRKVKHFEDKQHFDQTSWIDKVVYSRENQNLFFEPVVCSKGDNYIERAKTFLTQGDLSECGNNIRKEMEKILQHMFIEFETGKRGELHNNIKIFTDLHYKYLYKKPQKILDDIFDILKGNQADTSKINEINNLFTSANPIELEKINKLLKDFQWHREIVGNSSSHAQVLAQYNSEFEQAIGDVKDLKQILNV